MHHLLLLLLLPAVSSSSCSSDLFFLRPPGGTSLLARTSACPGTIIASHVKFLACPEQPGAKEETRVHLEEGVAHLDNLHPHSLYLVKLKRDGEVVVATNTTTRPAWPEGGPIVTLVSASATSLKFTWPRVDLECKKHRSQLGSIQYIVKAALSGKKLKTGSLELTSTEVELEELQPSTNYSITFHITRDDGKWNGEDGKILKVATLPLSLLPPHLILLLPPLAIVLLGLLLLQLVRLARRTKQKVQFKRDVKRYLQEEQVNLSHRGSISSSQATTATYVVDEPTYAVIAPKPRITIDPLPELPERRRRQDKAPVVKVLTDLENVEDVNSAGVVGGSLENVNVVRESSLVEGQKEIGYVWVTKPRAVADDEQLSGRPGYSRANFGRLPLNDDRDEIDMHVNISVASYIASTK